jgi:hypothetical protein
MVTMSRIIEGLGRKILDNHKERDDDYFFNCPKCGKLHEVKTCSSLVCCGMRFTPKLFSEIVITEVKKRTSKGSG